MVFALPFAEQADLRDLYDLDVKGWTGGNQSSNDNSVNIRGFKSLQTARFLNLVGGPCFLEEAEVDLLRGSGT